MGTLSEHIRRPGVQAIIFAVASGLGQVMMAVISILVARSATASGLGKATIVMSLAVILVGLLDFGQNALWLRNYASDPGRRAEMAQLLTGKLLVTGVAALVVTLAALSLPALHGYQWMGFLVIALQVEQTLQTPLRARRRVVLVSASTLANRVAALVAVVLLGFTSIGPIRLVVAVACGSVVGASILWWGGARSDMATSTRALTLINPWQGSRHYGVYSLSTSLQSLDAPLLGAVSGATAVGLYGAVNRWTQPVGLLTGAFSSASVPHVAAAGGLRKGWQAIKKSSILLVGALLASLLVVLFAPLAIHLLLGDEYAGSVHTLQLLAISMMIVVFNQPAAMLLQSTGHDRIVGRVLPLGVLIQMIGIAVFGRHSGATGAAIAAVCGQGVIALFLARSLIHAWRSESNESLLES